MLKRIHKWLAHPVFPGDEEKTAQSSLLNRVELYLAALLLITQFVFVPLFAIRRLETSAVILLMAILMLVCRWLHFRGRLKLAAALLTGVTWSVLLVLTYLGGGLFSPFIFALLAMTVIIGVLLGALGGLIVTAFTALIWLAFAISPPVHYFNYNPLSTWFLFSLLLFVTAGLAHYTLRNFMNTLETSRRQARALQAAEITLRESENRFRGLFENANTGMFHCLPEWRFLRSNPALATMLGYVSPEEFIVCINEMSFPFFADPQRSQSLTALILPQEGWFREEIVLRRKDGRLLQAQLSARKVFDPDGRISYLEGFIEDISQRKQAERRLREDAERLNLILEACSDGVWDWDIRTDAITFSPGYIQKFGYEPGEFARTNSEWMACVHPDDRQRIEEADDDALHHNANFSQELRIREKSGRWHWVLSRGVVLERDSQGKALRMVGSHTDIQGLKTVGEALLESQVTLSAVINSTEDYIWSVDPETFSLQTFNQGYYDFFLQKNGLMVALGMRPEQLYASQEYVQMWHAFYQRALREGKFSTAYTASAGQNILELTFNLFKRDGAVFGISVFGRDITLLVQAEAALRESETRFRSISENALTGIYVIQDGRLAYVNDALARILGYTVAELTGTNPQMTIQPEDQTLVAGNLRRRLDGETPSAHYEFRARCKDGSTRICEVLGVRVDLQGKPAILGTILDISERKQAEELTQRRTAELTALNEIGRAFSKLAEPTEILDQIFTVIGRVLDNRNLYIALYDEASRYISFPIYSMRGELVSGGGRILADGITDHVIRTQQPILIKNDMAAVYKQLGIRQIGTPCSSFLAVPILAELHVLGVIALQDYERENIYDEHDLELLSTIAAQAAVALENSRLFHETQASQARFRAVVEHNHDGIIMLNAGMRVLYASPSYYRMLGYPPGSEEIFGTGLLHPDDRKAILAALAALVERPGDYISLEFRQRHNDGHWFWVETTAANLLNVPDVGALVLNCHDFDERKQAEEALRESEERYRLLIDHTPNAVVVHSQGMIEFVNPACVKLLGGASPADFVGREVLDFIHPDKHAMVLERTRLLNEKNQAVPQVENIYVRLDGQPVQVEATGVPFMYQGHRAVLSTITDISERKRTAAALRESEERYRLLIDHSPNAVVVHNGGKIEFINPAGVVMMGGASPADFIGRDVLDFVDPSMRSAVLERMQAAYQQGQPGAPLESLYIRLDGLPVQVETSTVPFNYQGHAAVLVTMIDISQRKQAEEALQRRNAYLQALQETSLELVSQLDLPTLLQNIVKRAGQLVGTDSGYLDMAEPGSDRLVPMVGYGALSESLKFPVGPGEGITGLVLKTHQPAVLDDYDNWPGRTQGFTPGLIRAIISVPLLTEALEARRSGSEVLGVLGLAYPPEIERKFGDEEIRLLSDFARLAVLAIQNARLYQQATDELQERKLAQTRLKKRAAQLTLIRDVGQKIAGVLDPQGVLELAARLVNESFGYHHVAIFTFDESGDQLQMRASAGKFTRLFPIDHSVRLGDGMVGYVAKSGRRLLARDVSRQTRYKNFYPDIIPTQSELSLPLKAGSQVVGVLDVQSPELNAFGRDDLNVLQTVADEVAVALENARLYASVQTELAGRRQVEAELINYRDHLEDMVRERTSQLEIAMKEAEAANRAKSDFLAVMSHEIRTPLNGVLGLTHLTLQTSLTDKQRDYLARVEESGESLLSIINDILDFSKIESGRLDLEQADFDLDEILHSLSNALSYQAQQKELELVYDIAPNVPRRLVGDSLRLRQVLLNLTGNAVKFTEKGAVVLKISLRQRLADRVVLNFSVRDTGIGMTPAQMAGLFQPFSQVDSSTSRKYGGTGLGLAISQRLVGLMGGEIKVESEFGAGTLFSFNLAFEAKSMAGTLFVVPENLNSLRILVLDDHPLMVDFLKSTLESFSHHVMAFPSAEAALASLPAVSQQNTELAPPEYDLLLVDWGLAGEMRGLETARRLRTHPYLARAHVIMLVSSQEMVSHVESDLDGFLLKPVTRSRLFDSIMNTFGYSTQHSTPSGLPEGQTLADIQSLRGRRVLVVEDNSINQVVARDMLQNLGLFVTLADSGEQALDLLEVEQFDAVLMDIQMPGMDGYQTTAQIRANPRFAGQHLPIIAMTAHAMKSDRDKALSAGLDDHISKPVDVSQLTGVLLRWLASLPAAPSAALPTGAIPNAATPTPARPAPPRPALTTPANETSLPPRLLARLNSTAAINRLGGDQKLYRRILGLFRDEHAGLLAEIQNALLAGDEALARSRTHSLKGLAGTLGADEIMALAKQLETAIASGDQAQVQDCLADLHPLFSALIAALQLLN